MTIFNNLITSVSETLGSATKLLKPLEDTESKESTVPKFPYKPGRIPVSEFEKRLKPAPNAYPNRKSYDVTESTDIDQIRIMAEINSLMTAASLVITSDIVKFAIKTYSIPRIEQLKHTFNYIGRGSTRDQIINLLPILLTAAEEASGLRFDHNLAEIEAFESEVRRVHTKLQSLLLNQQSVVITLTNNIFDLTVKLPSKSSEFADLAKMVNNNPLLAYVPAQYLKDQSNSLPPQSGALNTVPVQPASDQVAATLPAGRVAAPSEPETASSDSPVGPYNENETVKLVEFIADKYQFKHTAALVNNGYLHAGRNVLENDANWTGKDDVTSYDTAKAEKKTIVRSLLRAAYKRLLNKNVITKDQFTKVAGILAKDLLKDESVVAGADALLPEPTSDLPPSAQSAQNGVAQTSFNAPSSSAAPQYPYNAATQYEAGHSQEFDSTPGNERVAEHHASGTGYEIDKFGNKVMTVRGDDYVVIIGDGFVRVGGNVSIHVDGHASIVADTMAIKADSELSIEASTIRMTADDMITTVNGNHLVTVDGNAAESVSGHKAIHVNGANQSSAETNTIIARSGAASILGQELSLTSASTTAITSAGSMSVSSSGNLNLGSTATTSIASSGTIQLSHPVQSAKYAESAGGAPLGVPVPQTLTTSATPVETTSKDIINHDATDFNTSTV